MTADRFHYWAFGLAIASALELPQLPKSEPPEADEDIDLVVQLGPVEAEPVALPGLRRNAVSSLFRYQVRDGREATIDCLGGADPRDIADMISSRVLAIVAYQRNFLPLHASAVIAGDGVLAFSGVSGSGKSTLAAALAARGHIVVSDDMLVVDTLSGQPPKAWPGATRLKLSRQTLDHLGWRPDDLPLANTEEDKFLVGPVRADHDGWRNGLPLLALFQIGKGAPAIRPLRRIDAMANWPSFVRSPDLFPIADQPEIIWQHWLNVIGAVPVLALDQFGNFADLSTVVRLIEDFLVTPA